MIPFTFTVSRPDANEGDDAVFFGQARSGSQVSCKSDRSSQISVQYDTNFGFLR